VVSTGTRDEWKTATERSRIQREKVSVGTKFGIRHADAEAVGRGRGRKARPVIEPETP